jgi:hypothetical protein
MARRHPEYLAIYYRSHTWSERVRLYYSRHERRCASCGWRGKRIALHHMYYVGDGWDLRKQSDWGKEPDQALIPLCMRRFWRQGCHENAHAADQSGKYESLEAATMAIVRMGRARQKRRQRYEELLTAGRRTDQRSPG